MGRGHPVAAAGGVALAVGPFGPWELVREEGTQDRGQTGSEAENETERWNTGTVTDRYLPVYVALHRAGVSIADADRMDISVIAAVLGVRPEDVAEPEPERPELAEVRGLGHGLGASGFKPPWWKGDKAAFDSSVRAQKEASEHPGGM